MCKGDVSAQKLREHEQKNFMQGGGEYGTVDEFGTFLRTDS